MAIVRSGISDRAVKPGDDALNRVTLAGSLQNQKASPKLAI
jgi:hypothetical protein